MAGEPVDSSALYRAAALVAAASLHSHDDPPVPARVLRTAQDLFLALENDMSPGSHNEEQLQAILALVTSLDGKADRIMGVQDDINDAVAFQTQLSQDIEARIAQVQAGQAALDQLIQSGQADTTQLKAVQLVLAGDQANLDAAVDALNADPNLTPAPPAPVPSPDQPPAV